LNKYTLKKNLTKIKVICPLPRLGAGNTNPYLVAQILALTEDRRSKLWLNLGLDQRQHTDCLVWGLSSALKEDYVGCE
jgi:hypothetical protein